MSGSSSTTMIGDPIQNGVLIFAPDGKLFARLTVASFLAYTARIPAGRGSAVEPYNVLVVDDDASIRASMADLLQDRGYRVSTATDGRNALELLRSGDVPD